MRSTVLAVLAFACGPSGKSPMNQTAQSPLAAEAVAGVSDPGLRAVISDHWEHTMRWLPTFATTLGDHRYDDKIAPRDAASVALRIDARDALIDRLVKLDAKKLVGTDAVTYALLRGQLEAERGLDRCKFWQWTVDSGGGSVFGELSYLVESHTVKSPGDAENVLARMKLADRAIDDTIANLTLGLEAGRVASAEKVRRAVEQLDGELAKTSGLTTTADQWAMTNPKWSKLPEEDPWPLGARARLHDELRAIVSTRVVPAIARLRDFLRTKIMPRARTVKEGLAGLADGDACYRAAIAVHVGLPIEPAELHALGLAEIAKSDAEIARLGKQLFGTPDLASTIAKLRGDKTLYFTSREEILAVAQRSLDRARAAMPRYFGILPKTDCVMREIPEYEAPYTTIAYYRQPHYDGSKPGEYFVNTYKPETRPRFELEALTWHESIPGHHLQIALSQELGAMPMFRKLEGSTAYVEGWALYTERLAEEMGLYTADLDRLGKLSYDAWRGSRLVVDTGLHSMGWTRARAEQFMREHTALTEVNISNEVDRYIGWPGQALAYKVGQLEIVKLRADAQRDLGAKFDLKAFHDVVLGAGAVTLPVLRDRVHAWVASRT